MQQATVERARGVVGRMTGDRWWDEGDGLRSLVNGQVLAGLAIALLSLVAVPGWPGKIAGIAAGAGWVLYHLAGQRFDSFSRWARRNDLSIPPKAPERLLALPQVHSGQDHEVIRAAWGKGPHGLQLAYVVVEDDEGTLDHLAVVRCPQPWPDVQIVAHAGDRTHPAYDVMPPLHQQFVGRYTVECADRRAAARLLDDDTVQWLTRTSPAVHLHVRGDTAVITYPDGGADDSLEIADLMLAQAREFAELQGRHTRSRS